MILIFDVGNTNIKIVAYENFDIVKKITIKTDYDKTPDDYFGIIMNFFDYKKIKKIVISSVVPKILTMLKIFSEKHFMITPLIIAPGIKTGVIIKSNPSEIGSDIISDCAYAIKRVDEAIIVDLGSANKYIYVKNKSLIGAMISTGIEISISALSKNTALLPTFTLSPCDDVLGSNTIEALKKGAFFSLASEIEGNILRIKEKIKSNPTVYLTGGAAKIVKDVLKIDFIYVENLTILGIIDIYLKNEGVWNGLFKKLWKMERV